MHKQRRGELPAPPRIGQMTDGLPHASGNSSAEHLSRSGYHAARWSSQTPKASTATAPSSGTVMRPQNCPQGCRYRLTKGPIRVLSGRKPCGSNASSTAPSSLATRQGASADRALKRKRETVDPSPCQSAHSLKRSGWRAIASQEEAGYRCAIRRRPAPGCPVRIIGLRTSIIATPSLRSNVSPSRTDPRTRASFGCRARMRTDRQTDRQRLAARPSRSSSMESSGLLNLARDGGV